MVALVRSVLCFIVDRFFFFQIISFLNAHAARDMSNRFIIQYANTHTYETQKRVRARSEERIHCS